MQRTDLERMVCVSIVCTATGLPLAAMTRRTSMRATLSCLWWQLDDKALVFALTLSFEFFSVALE
jgi:hypothetical protein